MNCDEKHEPQSIERDTVDGFSDGSNEPLKLKILLIDDADTLLFILESALSQKGHEVFTTRSGLAGIRLFEANPVDAVICDLGLEDIDGRDVGGRIRDICEESNRNKPPIILMTGLPLENSEHEEILSSGVDIILEKPVELPDLIEALNNLTL